MRIVVIKKSWPSQVFAVHAESQLPDLFAVYPPDEFDLFLSDVDVSPRSPTPEGMTPIERPEEGGGV